ASTPNSTATRAPRISLIGLRQSAPTKLPAAAQRSRAGLALNRNVTPHHLTKSFADHEAKSGTDWKIGWLRPPGLPPIPTLHDIHRDARSLLRHNQNPAQVPD